MGVKSDFRVSFSGNPFFSLSSPPRILSPRLLSASLRVAGTRPSGHLRPHGRSPPSRLLPLYYSRPASGSILTGIVRKLVRKWRRRRGSIFARVFYFRPNYPVNLHGSGSPPSQEPSATGPDQIHGRTAPEKLHESGDPHRLSR